MADSGAEPEPKQRRSDIAARALEAKITGGDFVVGAKLPPEGELAGLFGVGRSSTREAVRTLEAAGYLRSAHGSGVYVTNDRPRTIAQLDQSLLGGYTMRNRVPRVGLVEELFTELDERREVFAVDSLE